MNYLNVRLVKSAVAGVLAGWLLASCSSGYSLAGVEGAFHFRKNRKKYGRNVFVSEKSTIFAVPNGEVILPEGKDRGVAQSG